MTESKSEPRIINLRITGDTETDDLMKRLSVWANLRGLQYGPAARILLDRALNQEARDAATLAAMQREK